MGRRRFLSRMIGAGAVMMGVPVLTRSAGALPRVSETTRAWRAMGTLIEVRVPDLPGPEAVAAIGEVRKIVEELEAAMTLFRPESPLVAFNHLSEGIWQPAPATLLEAVAIAGDGHLRDPGFDPTVAPALRARGLYQLRGGVVNRQLLLEWKHRSGMPSVEVDAANRRFRRHDHRVELDLGGVGKGIAVDRALQCLKQAGSGSALVNLGGSIGVLGPHPEVESGWPIAVAHPRSPGDSWLCFDLKRGHVATSGDYERRHRTNLGVQHHLLDPVSGVPTSGVASLTVWAENGTRADLDSTSGLVRLSRGESTGRAHVVLALGEEDGQIRAYKSPTPDDRERGFSLPVRAES